MDVASEKNGRVAHPTLSERLGLTSLLGRYLYVVALLTAVLVGSAWYAHHNVRHTSGLTGTNLHERAQIRQRLRSMMHELWLLENILQNFLLTPGAESRRRVGDIAVNLIESGEDFSTQRWVLDQADTHRLSQQFVGTLRLLRTETARLLAIREIPEKLFPGMPVMVGHMLPAATEFYTQATLAMDEAGENKDAHGQAEALQLFTDARHTQTLLIGAFRLWVANRSGVFGEIASAMRAQATNIELYSERIEALLVSLGHLNNKGQLGIQQEESYKKMHAAHSTWRRYYREIQPIYNSDRWRADVPLLRDSVHVLLLGAWESLREMERQLETASNQDITTTTDLADRLSGSLWILVLIGILSAATGILVLEMHIRRPLARVSRALKAEAAGQSDAPLPQTHIVETRNLIEAFHHMRVEVHTRQERLQAVLDNTAEGIITFDSHGLIETWNHAAERLFGWSEQEILGTSLARLIAPESRETRNDYLEHFLRHEIQRLIGHEGEVTGRHKNGDMFPLSLKVSRMELDGYTRYTALVANIAERKALLEHLKQLAEHDGLTGLYNRSYFLEDFERLVSRVKRNEQASSALLYIDLDNFKCVNDTLGHAAGDRLLTEVASILARRSRNSDLVARLGGDEFVVILYDTDTDLVEHMAESYRHHLADHAFQYDGRTITIGCSIGIAIVDHRCASHTEALSHADLACHLAKRAGRNRTHVFSVRDAESVSSMSLDMGWSRRIRDAIDHNQFVLVGQPVICTRTRAVACHEILVRLRDEDGSLIMPSGFLPTAERFGLAAEIDQWIIARAIDQLAAVRQHNPAQRYAINLSAQSLTVPAVADLITRKLAETGVEPGALTFEVTETAAIADMGTAVEFLARLRALGCQTALDDFGSGMSSFAYLKDMPVDVVKIDGRFVRHLPNNPVDQAMVKAMNDIAHALGKITVAEFVESEDTFRLLGEIGVDYGQGYHLDQPAVLVEHGTDRPTADRLAARP